MVFNHDRLDSKNTTKHQHTYFDVIMVENLKFPSYKTLKMTKYEILTYQTDDQKKTQEDEVNKHKIITY
jgi:hypothetical protein